MRPTRWRRSTHVAVGVVVLLAGRRRRRRGRADDRRADARREAVAVEAAPAPATAAARRRSRGRLRADARRPTGWPRRWRPVVADPNLGTFTGRITDAMTGERAVDARAPNMPMQPASTNKVLTTAAALLTLDRDARLTTRVLAADHARGGGARRRRRSRRCRRRRRRQDTWYRDAARISDLADQVRRSGTVVTAVQVDVSAYSGPTMAPGWDPLDIDGGDIAPMEAVMLDGGRTQPVTVESRRSRTPALDAGRALAVALRVDPATVTVLPCRGERPGDRLGAVAAADASGCAR